MNKSNNHLINVPWTAVSDIPVWVKKYFHGKSNPWTVWNVHLNENNQTRSLDESVELLIKNLETISENDKVFLRWHSLGSRIIMNAIIKNPSILSKINHIQLICPPINMAEFANSKLFKIIQKQNPNIEFTQEYIESLSTDDETINDKFWEILKEYNYEWKLDIYADYNDPFLKKLDSNYGENIRKLVQKFTPEVKWFIKKYWKTKFPDIRLRFVWDGLWHNFEWYRWTSSNNVEEIKTLVVWQVFAILILWSMVVAKYNLDKLFEHATVQEKLEIIRIYDGIMVP